jgi:trimeric autotransporter adhesin
MCRGIAAGHPAAPPASRSSGAARRSYHPYRSTRVALFALAAMGASAALACWTGDDVAGAPTVDATLVTPQAMSLELGSTGQLQAIALDNTFAAIAGKQASWQSGTPAVASVDPDGTVHALALGVSEITASIDGKQATATVTVIPVSVATVTIDPPAPTVAVAFTTPLTAVTKDAAGNVLADRAIAWHSEAPGVATVDGAGVVTGVSPGEAVIVAESEGKSGAVTVTVIPAPVEQVEVQPPDPTVQVGLTITLSAVLRDALGNVLGDRQVDWASVTPAVATVDAAGIVTGVAPGTTTVTATVEGKVGSTTVTVIPAEPLAPVASVSISPNAPSVAKYADAQLTATLRDADNNVLTGRPIAWSTTPGTGEVTLLATSGATITMRGAAEGTATVTATSETKSRTVTVTVTRAPVATVSVSPAAVELAAASETAPAGTADLAATVHDQGGVELTDRTITWETSDADVATVASTGAGTARVTAVGRGTAVITARSEGKSDGTDVSVIFTFTAHAYPIFRANCATASFCHFSRAPIVDGATVQGSYDSFWTINSTTGQPKYFTPGDRDAGGLIHRMTVDEPGRMPPSGLLDPAVVNVIRDWIEDGARYEARGALGSALRSSRAGARIGDRQ